MSAMPRHASSKARRGTSAAWAPLKVPSVPLARWFLACATVFGVAVLINLPTLRYEFLSWDDSSYVTQNPWIRSWSRENLVYIFTKPYSYNFLPLHLLSYMADYSLWGLKPFGYHLHEVLLNAINALLGFVVVRRLLGSFPLAWIAGLLFAVHPSHVESVAWISSRKEVLATTFVLLSLYFYLRARRAPSLRPIPYTASVIFFALGVLSKVTVVVLPLFLLLVDLVSVRDSRGKQRFWPGSLLSMVPYGLIGLWAVRLNWLAQVKSNAEYAQEPLRYLMVKGHAVWNYLGLLMGIVPGTPIYDLPRLPPEFLPVTASLAGLLLLPAAVWIGHRHRVRALFLGAGWMFILLSPAIVFPLVTYMAERYLYAPSLGFCWILAAGILSLSGRAKTPALRSATAIVLTALLMTFFGYRTVRYNPVWANSEALWSYTIQRSEDFRAYNNLARLRMEQKRWDDAERLFKLGSRQTNDTSYDGLTAVYYMTGRYAEALQANDKSFEMHAIKGDDPAELAELRYKRGSIYLGLSRSGEAIENFEAALRANPRHADARKWLEATRQAAGQSR